MISIREQEFVRLTEFVRRHSGIELGPGKEYLLETRLQPLLGDRGFSSFTELCDGLIRSDDGDLRETVISAVSTNETLFFRDKAWFDLLRFKIFPDIIDFNALRFPGGKVSLRVWSAGCSTGQEVYSVIMAFLETVGHRPGVEIRVLGSDISDQAVSRASYGEFSDFEVGRGLESGLRDRYFEKIGTGWRVRDEVRAKASFSRLNLLTDSMPPGPFDVVLCRNVGIYFSADDRHRLFRRVRSALQTPGYLLLGSSESLPGDMRAGMLRQCHHNALYYINDSCERPAAAPAMDVERKAPPTSLPCDLAKSRAVNSRATTGTFQGRRDTGQERGGEATSENEYVRTLPCAPAPAEKMGVLAALQKGGGDSLLVKVRPASGRGVLEAIGEKRG